MKNPKTKSRVAASRSPRRSRAQTGQRALTPCQWRLVRRSLGEDGCHRFTARGAATALIVGACLLVLCSRAFAQGTAFSYQGQLQNSGSPGHGTYNLQFSLYTVATGGATVAGSVTTNGIFITNGLFAVTIDFGSAVWEGATNWLQISVESNGASSFTSLAPRQQIMPVPYSMFAEEANAAGLIGTVPLAHLPASILTNDQGTVTVSNLELNGPTVIISSGANSLFIADTNSDFFVGPGAGNLTCAPLSFGNTASGVGAMADIVDTVYNTADGYQALYSDTDGSDDTAVGALALYSDTNGFANTANGFQALSSVTSGFYNTAVGFQAGGCYSNSYNTAIGAVALWANWGGSYNTASGAYSLWNDTTGCSNTADGSFTLAFDNFGSDNTAVGVSALQNNLTGINNTAIGVCALQNNLANFNTANGFAALQNNTSGTENTGNGYKALQLNTVGNDNTADGDLALEDNTSGSFNTATGVGALTVNTAGQNTADGADALDFNGSGSNNLASGFAALSQNASGSYNVAVGSDALLDNVGGSENTAVGYQSLVGVGFESSFGGTADIAIGYLAGSAFDDNESGNIDIGNAGVEGESDIIRIGAGQSATYLSGKVYGLSFNSTSDRNAKEDFASVNPQQVLAKVVTLPLTEWNYKTDKGVEHIGPMAQDFHAAFGLNGGDDKHISVVDEGGVAFAAIQGLNQKLQEQQAENAQLREELNELKAEVQSLKQTKGDDQ